MIFLKVKNKIQNTRRGFTPTPIHIGVSLQSKRGFTPPPIPTNATSVFTGRWQGFSRGIFDRASRRLMGGFTLVETLVAISILLIAVVAPLSILAGNIRAVVDMKNKITALYLAEDGIDYVKNKINTNFNANQDWLLNIPSCPGDGAGGPPYCRTDSWGDTIEIQDCTTGCPALKFDSSTGVYNYTTGQGSKFTRTVTIAGIANDPYPAEAPQEVIITATVLWKERGANKQTILSEHAFSWR